ncbi:uncharacterized protein LOC112344443 [Selaginella moellendorffii]|uniref:uncharacterized protein LOC112344443 n=1 Tax=Selaginella moellendorffii TaxID=88036 RepID=UPI000D1C5AED|nr:uncharacterized protein LOC112344443 [Selaginella moellendorffii]|eukprot:XP_024524986.1 uncharacterized protein LOC112344443 [Selaginella moellendorffii]
MDDPGAREEEENPPILLDLRSSRTDATGTTDIRLTKLGSSIAITIALLWAALLILKFHIVLELQPFARTSRDWSPLQLSCFLGIEIGLLTIFALFILLIPAMILTWTTALLFDYACSRGLARRQLLIQDGNQLAREIVFGTLKSIVREGNFIAVLVALGVLLGAFFSSQILAFQGKVFNFW